MKTYNYYKNTGLYNAGQLAVIQSVLQELNEEQMEVLARPEFDLGQMLAIYYGFHNNLSMEDVRSYAKPGYSEGTMRSVANLLLQKL